jgi:2-polyprenyl-3-methyl-5-hydroxy-6-metoxy-1,4-benzoquinol methylase
VVKDQEGTFSEANYRAYQDEATFLAPCVAGAIVEVLDPASVVDLGCGLGIYLGALSYLGVGVKGYEFSPDAITHTEAPKGVVEYHDLREPLDAGRRYDLALCSQVAEHIDRWRST